MAPVEEPARERASVPARKTARVSQGPAVLAAMINGVALGEIAKIHELTPKRVEKLLRDELRKRWIAPAQDYARLQVARLEPIAGQLKEKCATGDLPSIDRLLKVLDRLDRYHGFTKLAALSNAPREDVRAQLLKKLEQAARKPEQET
jgi:hypothetical protein